MVANASFVRTIGQHRYGRLVAVLVVVPVGVAIVAIGLMAAWALSGVPFDASRWRDAVAQRASAALGRPVLLQGALDVEPSLGPELGFRVGSLRILNPPGYTAPHLLSIGELRVRVDLLEALRGRFRSNRIEVRNASLWLERGADGVGNWTSTAPRDSDRQAGVDIEDLTLGGLQVHYLDARSATGHAVKVDELTGSLPRDRPVRLTARGVSEPGLAVSIRMEGGPLRLLQEAAERWPFAVDIDAAGARLRASGAVDVPGASVRFSSLQGRLGESEFTGQAALDFGGARPRLTGAVDFAAVDVRPFIETPPGHRRESPQDPATPRPLPLRDLTRLDAEVDAKASRVVGLGVDVRDLRVALRAGSDGLRVPLNATIAGANWIGQLDLDAKAAVPALTIEVGATDAPVAELARALGVAGGVEGTIGHVALRVDGRGETLDALAEDVGLALRLAATTLRFGGEAGERKTVAVDALDVGARPGARLTGHGRGSLLGEPAQLRFRGGALTEMRREGILPLQLDLVLAHARLKIDGRLALAESSPGTALRFDLQASSAGALLRPLGIASEANLPVAVRGQVRQSDDAWRLDDTTIELGRSRATVDARSARVAGRRSIVASVRSPGLDASELSTLAGGAGGGRSDARASAAIDLPDAEVDVRLQRVRFGRMDLDDVAFVARSRDGRLLPATITGAVAGAPFEAAVDLDLKAPQPTASVALSAKSVDIGGLLRGLGIAEDIDARAEALRLGLVTRGSSPREWAAHSDIDARMRGGSLTVLGPLRSAVADIRVANMRVGARAGEPLTARIEGEIESTPVTIDLSTGTLAEFARDASRVPFALAARGADTQVTLDGAVSLPLGSGGQLNFAMRGERLDSLSSLARVELPAWGPWSFSGPIRMTDSGYELQGLQAQVGRSRLGGNGRLDVGGPRPRLELQVTSPSLQLDDFPPPDRLTDSPEPNGDSRGLREAALQMAASTDRLLGARFLRRLDAIIDLQAAEVLSGDDHLADGALRLKLESGRLDLDPVVVNLPGGALRLALSYDLKGNDVEFGTVAYVDRFDYGIIARRLGRGAGADVRGLFSLNLQLAGTAPSLDTIMRNADGRIDFAVWPTELRSGVFDLWTVNMVLRLLPLIDSDAQSKVNCVVGRFDLERGKLVEDKMVIDTTALRIRGTGRADLKTEELAFVFRPRAKGFALFRLQTPLRVTGTLDEQRFGVRRGDLVKSVLQLIASPIVEPIEWLTVGPLPHDGADVCTDPLRALAD